MLLPWRSGLLRCGRLPPHARMHAHTHRLPFHFFIFLFFQFCFVHFKVIYWFFFFLSFLSFPSVFLHFFPALFLSSWTLSHLRMHVLVMSIDSKFVFEFIAWVMVIMLVHSICQKWIHTRTCTRVASATCRTWVNDFQRHARESGHCFASQAFSLSS